MKTDKRLTFEKSASEVLTEVLETLYGHYLTLLTKLMKANFLLQKQSCILIKWRL